VGYSKNVLVEEEEKLSVEVRELNDSEILRLHGEQSIPKDELKKQVSVKIRYALNVETKTPYLFRPIFLEQVDVRPSDGL